MQYHGRLRLHDRQILPKVLKVLMIAYEHLKGEEQHFTDVAAESHVAFAYLDPPADRAARHASFGVSDSRGKVVLIELRAPKDDFGSLKSANVRVRARRRIARNARWQRR
jgi:hypothetical protein